ncbi:hypothetical protein BTH42_18595 [Burkholderia sp. SRS-W-2-2016]|nr:hypothetical protein BTH42_18595 [Burkholderia sp. SRS-W-2-2016]
MRRAGLAYSSMYEAMRLRGFPKPVKVGGARSNRWVLREVDAWIASRIAERDASAKKITKACAAQDVA